MTKTTFMSILLLIIFTTSVLPVCAQDWRLGGNGTGLNLPDPTPTAGNPNANVLGTTVNVPLRIFTNNIERMRITPAGNVGIGISTFPNNAIGNLPATTSSIGLHVQSPTNGQITTGGFNPTLVLTGHPLNPNPTIS